MTLIRNNTTDIHMPMNQHDTELELCKVHINSKRKHITIVNIYIALWHNTTIDIDMTNCSQHIPNYVLTSDIIAHSTL